MMMPTWAWWHCEYFLNLMNNSPRSPSGLWVVNAGRFSLLWDVTIKLSLAVAQPIRMLETDSRGQPSMEYGWMILRVVFLAMHIQSVAKLVTHSAKFWTFLMNVALQLKKIPFAKFPPAPPINVDHSFRHYGHFVSGQHCAGGRGEVLPRFGILENSP